jgi:phosphoribosylformylglycinamidine synthase PurS subunit
VKTYRIQVRVMPRSGLLDPAGQAVEHALTSLGFVGASNVHLGKAIALDLEGRSEAEAEERARAMCERLLANPVTEDFTIEVTH